MKSLTIVLFWMVLASCLFAQKEVIVKKNKTIDKVVTVDVQKAGEGERTIKIVTGHGGDQKVIEWTDNGEIPDEIKKQLEEENIDIKMLDGSDGRGIGIEVDDDMEMEDGDVHKEMIVIRKDDDGEVVEFEWDGEGEMPEEMKELMEEHNIEMGELHEGHGNKKMRKAKMRVMKDKNKKMRQRAMKKGRSMNIKEKNKYKIVTKDEDGNEKVIEWNGEGEMPEGMEGHLDEDDNVFIMKGAKGMHRSRGNDFVFFSDDDEAHLSDAYMGAQIESADNGARIIDVMKDSPADKAGLQRDDIVQRVNGARARSMDDLLNILNFFDPKDNVELTVSRGGSEKKIKMTLGKRPDSYK